MIILNNGSNKIVIGLQLSKENLGINVLFNIGLSLGILKVQNMVKQSIFQMFQFHDKDSIVATVVFEGFTKA